MTSTCQECGSKFSATRLDGTMRAECPVCGAKLGQVSSSALDAGVRAIPPAFLSKFVPSRLYGFIAERAARKNPNKEKALPSLEKWRESLSALGLTFVLGCMGIGFAAHGYIRRAEQAATLSWPTTPGVIAYCELETVRTKPRYHFEETIKYAVHVSYDYKVGDASYRGDRIAFIARLTDQESAFQIARKYEVGSTHQVYYNPESPDASLLQPGLPAGYSQTPESVIGLWLPLILIPASLFSLLLYLITK